MQKVITLASEPEISGFASIVGKKEAEGPLKDYFDIVKEDTSLACETWEQAESLLQQNALYAAMKKAKVTESDLDVIFAGDLLNQCTASGYSMKNVSVPFAGVYGACSTMALSAILAAICVDSGAADRAGAVTSSHFCSAERQFRKPIEYGGQRTPTSQWTVTGAGCLIFEKNQSRSNPCAKKIIFGKVRDLGITDENNMGAAMAPAACDTIGAFLELTETKPEDYDLILTGDLGEVGTNILYELMIKEHGIDISSVHGDCGLMIYDRDSQDVHAGGSGCGCSASVLCSKIMQELSAGKIKNVLFTATGALLSPVRTLQGESIPGIAHGILFTGGKNG